MLMIDRILEISADGRRGKIIAEKKNPVNRLLHGMHTPALTAAMRWRGATVVFALVLLAVTYYPYSKLGSEFMPPLDEGDILYMPTTFPGISITKAKELLQQTEGLQLPNDLLLYAKTLSYVFALGEQIAPEQDLMKLLLPYLLKKSFLLRISHRRFCINY